MPGEDSLETHWVEHARLDELEQPGFVLGTPLHGIARTIFIVSTFTVRTRARRAITDSLWSD